MQPYLRLFTEWASARNAGFGSPQPMGWHDMLAWAELTDTVLSPFDARVLRLLDAAWVSTWAEVQPKQTPARRGASSTR